MLNAGVVDQDVEAAELAMRRGHHVGDLIRLGHVGGMIEDANARLGGQVGTGLFDDGGVAQAVQHHVAAALRDSARQSQADAGRRAGDDGHLALEIVHGEHAERTRELAMLQRSLTAVVQSGDQEFPSLMNIQSASVESALSKR
ncbi:hypothetical protein D3C80_1174060 [compost metagenome]